MKKEVIKIDSWGRIPLYSFRDWVDIYKVEYYSIKINKDKTLTVKFYDKKRKKLKINE